MELTPLPELIANNFASTIVFLPFFLHFKPKKLSWLTLCVFLIISFGINYFATWYIHAFPGLNNVWITFVLHGYCMSYELILFEGKFFDKLTFSLFCAVNQIISILAGTSFCILFGLDGKTVLSSSIMCVAIGISYLLILFAFLKIRYKSRNTYSKRLNILLCVLLFSQIVMILLSFLKDYRNPSYTIELFLQTGAAKSALVFTVIMALFDFVIFFVANRLSKHYALIEQQQLATVQAAATEKYNEMTDTNLGRLRSIIADCRLGINKARSFFSKNKSDEAIREIQKAADSLKGVYKSSYCENQIVNILLISKLRYRDDISAEITIELPDELNIEKVDLCRIFSNLIDNAVTALDDERVVPKFLRIQAYIEGKQMFIRFENSFVPPSDNQQLRPGLGLQILKDIAGKYHGKLISGETDKTYISIFKAKAL